MNIKTTIVLLVLLLGVGAYVFFTRDKANPDDTPKHDEHTLLDVKEGLVTGFSITGSDGKTISAQKSKNSDGMDSWMLTSPVKAPAETYKVSSLISALTTLKSSEQMSANAGALSSTELDKPQYTIDLNQGPTTTELKVGKAQSVGDGVYVQVKGHDEIDVVPASVLETLSKPASSLRKDRLFETAAPSVMQLTVAHRTGPELAMQKDSGGWRLTKPEAMPADSSAVEDLASAVINMQPVEYVDDPSMALGLDRPQATVTFSTIAPATQPTTLPTTQMAGAVKVIFGSYDDVNKKNVFAQIPDGTIVKVPASVLDSLNKKPLDLRDKTIVNIDPATVNKISIASNQPATTQPVAPAVVKLVAIERRPKEPIGPPKPVARATTGPTTGPATMPVVEAPRSEWVLAGKTPTDADDSKVTTLLGQFHPLKAEKYLEKMPASKIVKTYTVTIVTSDKPALPTIITLVDPGNEANLIGTYNGLTFEVLRSVANDWGGEFGKVPAAAK